MKRNEYFKRAADLYGSGQVSGEVRVQQNHGSPPPEYRQTRSEHPPGKRGKR